MYRFLYISFLTLALVIGVAGAAPTVNAQGTGALFSSCPNGNSDCASGVCTAGVCSAAETETPAATSVTDQNTGQNNSTTIAAQSQDSAYDGIMIKIMTLFAWLVGAAALLLDYAVYYTVVTMGNYVSNLTAVGVAWRILRDISNIALIFGFLAIGISIILNSERFGYGTKLLPNLLMAAVFLNFSLFFTEAIIDGGNLFATQFYTQINGGVPASKVSLSLTTVSNEGISNKIMSQLGLQTIYGQARDANTEIFKAGNPWLIGFMGILLFIVTAFVMLSLAFILIARFVALIFIIILAPIGVVGLAIPQLNGASKKWWSTLVQQTITAPVLLLMLYIALAVITDAQFLTGFGMTGGDSSSATGFVGNANIPGFASFLLSFVVAIGLLLAVVVYAKKLSAFGASGAINLAGKATGALSFGAISLAGRSTLGVVGYGLSSKGMQARASKGGLGGFAAKTAVFTGRNLENRTFDARNIPGVRKAGSFVGSIQGNGLGGVFAGGKTPITAKGAIDKSREIYKNIKPSGDLWRNQQNEYEKAKAELERDKILNNPTTSNSADIAKQLSKTSVKELENLDGIKKGIEELVINLSPQQFESLMKSDKLSDGEKGKIKESRYHKLSENAKLAINTDINIPQADKDTARKIAESTLKSLSKGEIESIPVEMLENDLVLEKLSDKQRDTINDSKERTAEEKEKVNNASPIGKVKIEFDRDPILGPINVAKAISTWPPTQIAKLPAKILTSELIADRFTPAILIAIQEEKKLTSTEMTTIGEFIKKSPNASQKAIDYVTTGPGAALWS